MKQREGGASGSTLGTAGPNGGATRGAERELTLLFLKKDTIDVRSLGGVYSIPREGGDDFLSLTMVASSRRKAGGWV